MRLRQVFFQRREDDFVEGVGGAGRVGGGAAQGRLQGGDLLVELGGGDRELLDLLALGGGDDDGEAVVGDQGFQDDHVLPLLVQPAQGVLDAVVALDVQQARLEGGVRLEDGGELVQEPAQVAVGGLELRRDGVQLLPVGGGEGGSALGSQGVLVQQGLLLLSEGGDLVGDLLVELLLGGLGGGQVHLSGDAGEGDGAAQGVGLLLPLEHVQHLVRLRQPPLPDEQVSQVAVCVRVGREVAFLASLVQCAEAAADALVDVDGLLAIEDGDPRLVDRPPSEHDVAERVSLARFISHLTLNG